MLYSSCAANNFKSYLVATTGLILIAFVGIHQARADGGLYSQPLTDPAKATATSTDQLIVVMKPQNQGLANAATRVKKVKALTILGGRQLTYARSMSGRGHVLKLNNKLSISDVSVLAEVLSSDPDILSAEPDLIMQGLLQPNDTFYGVQWHYHSHISEPGAANLPSAWDVTTGNSDVVIAVIDTGILPHLDLAGRTVSGYDFISTTLVSNDGDGRDANPVDSGDWTTTGFCYAGSPTSSSSWHGTHVAGTIGAATNNATGVSGVTWGSKIQPVRVLGRCGGYTSDIADGIRWAAGLSVAGVPTNTTPAKVLNLSLGGGYACTASSVTQLAINDANANGAVVVVAAGNSNSDAANFSPASCSGVITVAANTRAGGRASYSNYGSSIEIAAPGGSIPLNPDGIASTLDSGSTTATGDNSYYYYQGTSMATPHVAGIAALLFSANHDVTGSYLNPSQVNNKIASSARAFPTGTASDCNTSLCGAGIIDATDAVSAVSTAPVVNAGDDSIVGGGIVVLLNGSASDDGSVSRTQWLQTSGTAVTISNADTLNASFISPAANDNLSFRLKAIDDVGIEATDNVNVTIDVFAPPPGPEPTNTAPVANDLSISTPKNTPVSDTVSGFDADGDSITFSVVNTPGKGSVSLDANTGAFTYTPNKRASGSDSFTFVVNDGQINSNTATISIAIVKGSNGGGGKKGGGKPSR